MTLYYDRTLEEFEALPKIADKLRALDDQLGQRNALLWCIHLHAELLVISDRPIKAHLCLAHAGSVACGECADYHLSADRRRGDRCTACGRDRDAVPLELVPITRVRPLPGGRTLDLTVALTVCRRCGGSALRPAALGAA